MSPVEAVLLLSLLSVVYAFKSVLCKNLMNLENPIALPSRRSALRLESDAFGDAFKTRMPEELVRTEKNTNAFSSFGKESRIATVRSVTIEYNELKSSIIIALKSPATEVDESLPFSEPIDSLRACFGQLTFFASVLREALYARFPDEVVHVHSQFMRTMDYLSEQHPTHAQTLRQLQYDPQVTLIALRSYQQLGKNGVAVELAKQCISSVPPPSTQQKSRVIEALAEHGEINEALKLRLAMLRMGEKLDAPALLAILQAWADETGRGGVGKYKGARLSKLIPTLSNEKPYDRYLSPAHAVLSQYYPGAVKQRDSAAFHVFPDSRVLGGRLLAAYLRILFLSYSHAFSEESLRYTSSGDDFLASPLLPTPSTTVAAVRRVLDDCSVYNVSVSSLHINTLIKEVISEVGVTNGELAIKYLLEQGIGTSIPLSAHVMNTLMHEVAIANPVTAGTVAYLNKTIGKMKRYLAPNSQTYVTYAEALAKFSKGAVANKYAQQFLKDILQDSEDGSTVALSKELLDQLIAIKFLTHNSALANSSSSSLLEDVKYAFSGGRALGGMPLERVRSFTLDGTSLLMVYDALYSTNRLKDLLSLFYVQVQGEERRRELRKGSVNSTDTSSGNLPPLSASMVEYVIRSMSRHNVSAEHMVKIVDVYCKHILPDDGAKHDFDVEHSLSSLFITAMDCILTAIPVPSTPASSGILDRSHSALSPILTLVSMYENLRTISSSSHQQQQSVLPANMYLLLMRAFSIFGDISSSLGVFDEMVHNPGQRLGKGLEFVEIDVDVIEDAEEEVIKTPLSTRAIQSLVDCLYSSSQHSIREAAAVLCDLPNATYIQYDDPFTEDVVLGVYADSMALGKVVQAMEASCTAGKMEALECDLTTLSLLVQSLFFNSKFRQDRGWDSLVVESLPISKGGVLDAETVTDILLYLGSQGIRLDALTYKYFTSTNPLPSRLAPNQKKRSLFDLYLPRSLDEDKTLSKMMSASSARGAQSSRGVGEGSDKGGVEGEDEGKVLRRLIGKVLEIAERQHKYGISSVIRPVNTVAAGTVDGSRNRNVLKKLDNHRVVDEGSEDAKERKAVLREQRKRVKAAAWREKNKKKSPAVQMSAKSG
eukprot:gene33977-41119_t